MKKIFTLLFGIVLLVACTNKNETTVSNKSRKRVTIYLRSIEQNGEECLTMFDSNGNFAINDLTTDVLEGGTIIWKLEHPSGIRKIAEISSKPGEGKVYSINPKPQLLGKGYKLKLIKDLAKSSTDTVTERYFIEYYVHGEQKPVKIDPYIRILPEI
jgi:hypothetical protein